MGLARGLLLWGSRSTALRNTLPRYRFLRHAVSRFMPGEEIDDALAAAESLAPLQISTVITHLGENLLHDHEAQGVAEHYLDALHRIHRRTLDCHVSVKLTQLGLDLSRDLCVTLLEHIVLKAKELGNVVWIDMESSAYVDRTLDIYRLMRGRFDNVGVCLQAYLYRTASDVESLLPLAPSIRLVKGTYAESKNVAHRSKRRVDESFLDLSLRLLESRRDGMKIGIATHDLILLEKIFCHAARNGLPKDSFEIQMLYGIKREQQLRLAREGYRVRMLISYGSFWFPWYMRRLAERPANVLFALRNLISR
jgi:proline dehydrogenase